MHLKNTRIFETIQAPFLLQWQGRCYIFLPVLWYRLILSLIIWNTNGLVVLLGYAQALILLSDSRQRVKLIKILPAHNLVKETEDFFVGK